MQARIKKSEIESFKTQASFIRPNNTLPILSYLKVEIVGDFCNIVKTNMEAFVQRTLPSDCEDCSFLVDERILYSFVDFSSSEHINFTKEGNRIKIYDERTHTFCPTEDSKMYPPIETSIDNWMILPKLALVSAGLCAQIIMDGEVLGPQSYVFVGQENVAGSDASIGYMQKIVEPLPELVLRKDVANCISKMNTCKYCRNNNYDFFKEDNSLYGFIKSEYPYVNISKIFNDINSPLSFASPKNQIIKFNNHCTSASTTKSIGVEFNCDGNNLNLKMVDGKLEIESKTTLYVKGGEGEKYFSFAPDLMNSLLKIIPCEEVHFYPGKNRYYITDAEKSFLGVIMQIML